ncbi:hypothetical protein FHT82_005946 [Rhizobium sp. BK275]|uniref:hypothetical protein n=1 Tax=Rhizobium sp. BK275 TaxID=2587077 RepID=UPI00160DB461|nr:hypothetical protein [Rhizobium sp. BK275]MBB3393153.1 hypothetical protein [Rhizobium sp. BK275]
MSARTLAMSGFAASAVFVGALIALVVSLYLSEPRTGPFDTQFSLVDDRGNDVDQSIFRGHPGADGRLKGLIPYGTDRDEALVKIRDVLLSGGV